MSIFVVNSTDKAVQVADAIKRAFPDDHQAINDKAYLVSFTGTAEELSKKLQISEGDQIGGVVTQVSSYYGRAPVTIWSWIKAKWESTSSGE
jgi:hypothetical protein